MTKPAATSSPVSGSMSGDEMVALSRKHTIYEWSAQSGVDPIPVARAKGVYFWTPEGKRFLDFNSQLMCVNIGHGDPRVVKAIQDQAAVAALRQPVHGHRAARPARREARRDHARATSTSSSSPTAAPRPTRTRSRSRARSPGRQKILARYRSYHGGTAGGDFADRRSAALEPAGHARRRPRARPVSRHRARVGHGRPGRCRYLEEVIQLEGPADDRRVHPRTGHRHQRHPHPA